MNPTVVNILWAIAIIIALIVVLPSIYELLTNRGKDKNSKKVGKFSVVNHYGMEISDPRDTYELAHKDFESLKAGQNRIALVQWNSDDEYIIVEQ